ncbi:MAG: efflux RND transporter periplasmic adaptor subunit [Hoeflea sp.]|uniref:efflux RND transporter periplasmic adaptor subunit n=1 Tax=Hoeflea sp. TaxID=1940281 RepID=UPI001D4D9BA6|nr:efflux RND transporter periplasmic adaptor subunit [Hoeflea sp.]MBU4528332.1 efflux RND transporter periplasmic adaptor subunit [Alphaproteobacteria bacterium]MBU4543001.1 efflux RND transporter periplasmic adaptor subunit [Alphaproteobacteria bacterium]MBU4551692.1 efflux RND transporter periplasmic adaptor subunit [Alphaproteobacteria bacterium]MBV1723587.1 efflux RND transporter periplasmic adaptor subunit [Hoeflea sp.]MBV1761903.1 efflux RND transporter periplasmic adaptor subunit [Hoef
MAMPRFHTIAAFVVLAVSAAWVATGEFSSIGSAAQDPAEDAPAIEQTAAEPQKTLRTVAVTEPDFIEHNRIIRISGVTAPDKRTTLATRSAGILGELKVKKGDTVQVGEVVLVLDGAEKQSMVDTARALLDQRQKEAENVDRLVKEGITPTTQIDSARSALASARSQLEAAQAEVDRLTVVAPFAGVIDQVMVEEGSWLPSGEAVAVLLQLDPVVARGEVSEREIVHVKIGSEADIRLISGDIVSGTVRHVSLEATAGTRTFPIEVAIPNPDNQVPAGMTAEIMIKSDPVTAVRLPRSVVTLDAAGNLGLRILKADSTVGFVPIDLIDDSPEGLVLSGVPRDAKIIVAGQDLVSEGDTVNAVPADATLITGATAKAAEQSQ